MKKRHSLHGVLLVVCGMGLACAAHASVDVSSLFTDHMVLQRQHADAVWGWATPGERITVQFGNHSESGTADKTGAWKVTLPAMQASTTGRNLIVHGSSNMITVHDVLVGDVWLCTGQSNMEFPINGWTHPLHVKEIIATSDHPDIRLIDVPNLTSSAPRKNFHGAWVVASPQTIANFPSVGYFFALHIQRYTHVPIGLVEADWGGTAIEPWIPSRGFSETPELSPEYQHLKHLQQHWKLEQMTYGVSTSVPTIPIPVASNQLPTVLYNAMISPLAGYGIRGALWYQGEQNVTDQTRGYFYDLKALIGSWRQAWGQGDFPFIIAQIAPFGGYEHGEMEPVIWGAQIKAAQRLSNVGIASTMDLGDLDNVHFKDKQDVGKRMALWALAKVYGQKDLVYSGPMYTSAKIRGSDVLVHFAHIGSGLASRDGEPLDWFQLAGSDGHFVDAYAAIKGDEVNVQAPSVEHPEAIRFGWSNVAKPNLMNKQGLPALPFVAHLGKR